MPRRISEKEFEDKYEEAKEAQVQGLFEKSEWLLLNLCGALDGISRDDTKILRTLKLLTDVLLVQEKNIDADRYLTELLYLQEKFHGTGSLETVSTLKQLAELHYTLSEFEKSLLYCRKMYGIKRKVYGINNSEVCLDCHTLAVWTTRFFSISS